MRMIVVVEDVIRLETFRSIVLIRTCRPETLRSILATAAPIVLASTASNGSDVNVIFHAALLSEDIRAMVATRDTSSAFPGTTHLCAMAFGPRTTAGTFVRCNPAVLELFNTR